METKEVLFEELKRSMLKTVEYRDGMPKEIENMVKKVFVELGTIFDEYNCNSSTIEMFCEGEFGEIKSVLNKTGQRRIESQEDQLNEILSVVRRDLESGYSNDELKSRINRHREGIEEIGRNDSRTIDIVLGEIDQALGNIRRRQTMILGNRGFSERRIDEINEEMINLARRVQRQDTQMEEIFARDVKTLHRKLQEKYDLFLADATKDKKAEFRKSLYGGISLEEQSENAKQFIDDVNENKKKTKARDLIPNILE